MTILLVTGTRTMRYKSLVYYILNRVKKIHGFDNIVVGDAKGVDAIVVRWCIINGVDFDMKEAKWKIHGKGAGPLRNIEMVNICDKGIAIWDSKSRGTAHCISELKKSGKLLEIFRYE